MANDDELQQKVDALIDDYLVAGCPCRFPRFRAVAARDTSKIAGGSFIAEDQRALLSAFERKVPLIDKEGLGPFPNPEPQMYAAKCGVCGSRIERSSNEYGPGAWVDYLVVRRPKGLLDLGARVLDGRPLRARPFRPAGPAMSGMARASEAFPMTEEDAWLAWMRERS